MEPSDDQSFDPSQTPVFNGIDGSTGEYLLPPLPLPQLSKLARGEKVDKSHLAELINRRDKQREPHFAPVRGVDSNDLSQAGWGAIFAHDADPAIREALRPLLDLRRSEAASKNERLYREFAGAEGYQQGDTKLDFLARYGAGGSGAVDPRNVPYFLLLVGSPEAIPYQFQYQVDVQYAVGRIHFDTPEEYARYAESVVRAETGKAGLPRRAAFWGAANPNDFATHLSAKHLAAPLAEFVTVDQPAWKVESHVREAATKARLASLLGGEETPALLFTASHGMGFPNGHARQLAYTGALLCQDWPGPKWKGQFGPDFYFGAPDVGDDAHVAGLIAMFFACYGGGAPKTDDFAARAGFQERKEIAPYAFVSALPKRLLAHPKGGALAVIGHVDRAWGCSYYWKDSGRQIHVFQSALKSLLEGERLGVALEYFNSRYAELSADLTLLLEEAKFKKVDDVLLVDLWTANSDARNYTVIGDPAVRVCAVDEPVARSLRMESAINVTSSVTSPGAAPAAAHAQEYGIFDSLRETQDKLTGVVQQVVEKLGASLEKTFDSLSTLEVNTYTTTEAANVVFAEGRFQGAKLRASTRVSLTGDTESCVPVANDGAVDEAIWKLHTEMVARAIEQRTAMWKAATEMASQLLGGLKR